MTSDRSNQIFNEQPIYPVSEINIRELLSIVYNQYENSNTPSTRKRMQVIYTELVQNIEKYE